MARYYEPYHQAFLNSIVCIVLIGFCAACTEFILRGKDESITLGRSIDHDVYLNSAFFVEPIGTEYHAVLNHVPESCECEGMTWRSRHKLLLIRPLEEDQNYLSLDGINDAGLTAAALNLPGYAVFENISDDRCSHAISQTQVVSYVLGQYGTVHELREAIDSNTFPCVWGNVMHLEMLQLHYSVTDKNGGAIVIEYTSKGRKVYDNTIRVMTNSPPYDWQMRNVKRYVHLEKKRRPKRKYHDAKSNEHVLPLLPASDLLCLPGDYSSPSRFVRTAVLVHSSTIPETSEEAVVTAFHILNSVDITKGVDKGRSLFTSSLLVKDLRNNCLYYRTYDYLSIRKVCLSDLPDEHVFLRLNNQNNDLEKFMRSVEDQSWKVRKVTNEIYIQSDFFG